MARQHAVSTVNCLLCSKVTMMKMMALQLIKKPEL